MERLRHQPLRAERLIRPSGGQSGSVSTALPSHEQMLRAMAEAERSIGWMAACEEAGRYLAVTDELIESLAAAMRDHGMYSALEVCAANGVLAEALRARGIDITATDVDPPIDAAVERIPADDALDREQPGNVIGCFVPFDSGVDRAVLEAPSVQRYLALNARLNGEFGDSAVWQQPGWTASRLESTERWMLTRHDVWLNDSEPPIRHGEAWLLERSP